MGDVHIGVATIRAIKRNQNCETIRASRLGTTVRPARRYGGKETEQQRSGGWLLLLLLVPVFRTTHRARGYRTVHDAADHDRTPGQLNTAGRGAGRGEGIVETVYDVYSKV